MDNYLVIKLIAVITASSVAFCYLRLLYSKQHNTDALSNVLMRITDAKIRIEKDKSIYMADYLCRLDTMEYRVLNTKPLTKGIGDVFNLEIDLFIKEYERVLEGPYPKSKLNVPLAEVKK